MNPNQGIYDARQLGRPKMLILGVQHMFAMFGATVLVPALTGLSVSATLLFAGLGTLLFHFLTKGKVPAFLGSSFAFIGGYQAIAPVSYTHLDVYKRQTMSRATPGMRMTGTPPTSWAPAMRTRPSPTSSATRSLMIWRTPPSGKPRISGWET